VSVENRGTFGQTLSCLGGIAMLKPISVALCALMTVVLPYGSLAAEAVSPERTQFGATVELKCHLAVPSTQERAPELLARRAVRFEESSPALGLGDVLPVIGEAYAMAPPCPVFKGSCTGSGGRRQCVIGPEAQKPDASIVEQCCAGSFQYPWIETCPNAPP